VEGPNGATQNLQISIDSPSSGPSGPSRDDDDDDAPDPIEDIGAEPTDVESVTPTVDTAAGQQTAAFETVQSVESVTLSTTESVGEVTVSELDPDTETETPAPGDPVTLQDVSVSEEARDTSATIRFRVSDERIEELSTSAENLRAFRLAGGDWQRLETSVAEETDSGVVLEAQTPGFSLFAVSAVTPPEASLSLNPTTAQIGEDVQLSGVDSADDGEIVSYEWTVNGQTFSGESVTVSLDEPGEYTVELIVTDDSGETDTVTQTLTIEQDPTETETTAPEPDTPTPEPETATTTDTGTPGFGVLVAILALLASALIAIRRRSGNK
jgi:PGF-pre-PGF domain-containing protein/PGF-CTERM protein